MVCRTDRLWAAASRPRGRRGVALPLAVFFLLALGALVSAAAALVHAELRIERDGLRYLEMRSRKAAMIGGSGPAGQGEGSAPLPAGFVLLRPGGSGSAPAAVRWTPEPEHIVPLLPGGAEVEGSVVISGDAEVRPLEECSTPPRFPLVRSPESAGGPAPSPRLPDFPSIVLLGVDELLALPGARSVESGPAGEASSPHLLHASSDARLETDLGGGVIVADGGLELGGGARFTGLVLVRGSLRMSEDARIDGIVLVGAELALSGGATIRGCPDLAAEALSAVLPESGVPVPAGNHLGRF